VRSSSFNFRGTTNSRTTTPDLVLDCLRLNSEPGEDAEPITEFGCDNKQLLTFGGLITMRYALRLLLIAGITLFSVQHPVIAEESARLEDKELSAMACPPDPKLGAEVAAKRFLFAFTRLDQACFDQMWTEDATAFLPMIIRDSGPGRLDGRAQILATFDVFFGDRDASEEDVMGIVPQSFRVDQKGDVAVVSFVLGPELDNRRTFIFRREVDGWRIWHHHASWVGDFDAILEAELQKRISEMSDPSGN